MNKRAIIAIEDDPGDQTLLRMAFDQCKFAHELRVFNTGEEALRHLVAAAAANSVETAPVALVLVDFNMPGLKGDEVIALMRANQRLRAIPAVMLDVGYPIAALKGLSLLARTASLIAHLQEESTRPIGFVMSGAAAAAISYDGEDPRG